MKIVSEIQRGGKKEGPSICITSQLSEDQKREITALGRACQTWEPITQEPFMDSSENVDPGIPCFYIYYENTFPLSFLSVFIPDGTYAEVTGYTLPGYRKKGHFEELLACAKEELKDYDLDFYLVSDGKSPDAAGMLEYKGWEYSHSERMMAVSMESLAELDTSRDPQAYTLLSEEGTYTLQQYDQTIGTCKLAYFPGGTAYLYGFEIQASLRRQGYARLFLKKLAQFGKETNHTLLLQVGSRNEPACRLYESCGFQITEQLNYYLI